MAQQAISAVVADIAIVCRSAPMAVIVAAYRRSARMFCQRSRWLTETVAGATAIATRQYTVTSAETTHEVCGIRGINIVESADDTHALTERGKVAWDLNDANGVPKFYEYNPEGKFSVHVLPDAIYTLSIEAVVQPKATAETIENTLLVNWRSELEDGALAYLLKLSGVPWRDPQEAEACRRRFEVAVHSASINASRRYNAGATPTSENGGPDATIRTSQLPI